MNRKNYRWAESGFLMRPRFRVGFGLTSSGSGRVWAEPTRPDSISDYDSCNNNLKRFTGQDRQCKINVLKRELRTQKTTLQRYSKTDSDIIRTSYEISKLIAKKLKPRIEGKFVK